VAHLDQPAVGLARMPVAAPVDVQPLHLLQQRPRLLPQLRGGIPLAAGLGELGGDPQAPHVGGVQRRDLVDVAADALEQVVDAAVVGERMVAAQAFPGGRPLPQVLGDAA
jgi:hypothetical protein